jgi:hypothetical protein
LLAARSLRYYECINGKVWSSGLGALRIRFDSSRELIGDIHEINGDVVESEADVGLAPTNKALKSAFLGKLTHFWSFEGPLWSG